MERETEVGPMINARQRERVERLIAGARAGGVDVRTGGSRPAALDKGFFYEPTVLTGGSDALPIYREEIFGPVLPVLSFDELDEAIALANSTTYGLAAYVWTNDLSCRDPCRGAAGVRDDRGERVDPACDRGTVRRLEAEWTRT